MGRTGDDEAPPRSDRSSAHDVVLLAGGRATRLGGVDKPALPLGGGASALQRLLDACTGASAVVVVGPRREAIRPDARLEWAQESPAGGGPLAAVAAGSSRAAAEVVVVLAADMPFAGRAVPALLEALESAGATCDAAVLVDGAGVRQPLAAAYRRPHIEAVLADTGDPAGQPARRLLEGARVAEVPDRWQAAADFDTWPDRDRIEELLRDE